MVEDVFSARTLLPHVVMIVACVGGSGTASIYRLIHPSARAIVSIPIVILVKCAF